MAYICHHVERILKSANYIMKELSKNGSEADLDFILSEADDIYSEASDIQADAVAMEDRLREYKEGIEALGFKRA